MKTAPKFTLYSRVYCHLCDDMERELLLCLETWGNGRTFEIEVIDVDEDISLEDRYGERVPVLTSGDKELCHYFLDSVAVRAYLDEIL